MSDKMYCAWSCSRLRCIVLQTYVKMYWPFYVCSQFLCTKVSTFMFWTCYLQCSIQFLVWSPSKLDRNLYEKVCWKFQENVFRLMQFGQLCHLVGYIMQLGQLCQFIRTVMMFIQVLYRKCWYQEQKLMKFIQVLYRKCWYTGLIVLISRTKAHEVKMFIQVLYLWSFSCNNMRTSDVNTNQILI
jgi:hypothetical protein